MNNEIIVSLIGFAGVCVGALFGYMGNMRKHAVQEARRDQQQKDRWTKVLDEMGEIKERLDRHNKYAEKFADIDKSLVSIKKDIEYIRKEKDEK